MYIDEEYLEDAFGAEQVAALCTTAGELATTIELAHGLVEGALTSGGYGAAVPASVYTTTDDVPATIKLAAYGAWLALAHGRNGKTVPIDLKPTIASIDDIREGKLEIPGVAKDVERAVGGVVKDEADASISTAKPQIFGRTSMEGY